MDFSRDSMQTEMGLECGAYEVLDPNLLDQIYVAYCTDVGEPTEVFHNNLRLRYDHKEQDVVAGLCIRVWRDTRRSSSKKCFDTTTAKPTK